MRTAASRLALFLALFAGSAAQAKIFLLLDDRMKGSALEQSIYKFVPLTNASEVELNYVHDFFKGETAFESARKLKPADRAIYVGTERWPGDAEVKRTINRPEWAEVFGKISFMIENDAPAYAAMPKSIFPRIELWKKYADISATHYLGFYNTHTLDARPEKLAKSEWANFKCVHESGRLFIPGKKSPVSIAKGQFTLSFRTKAQTNLAGSFVCINSPKSDAIFEVRAMKADIALTVLPSRFSVWNEARPLPLRISSDRAITAPLSLQIVPEVNQTAVDFVFQGEKITCERRQCRKRDARFLMPALRDAENNFELAYRGQGEAYFRGDFVLLSGEVEVARAAIKLTPHSWIAETAYALANPSEYKSLFLMLAVALILLCLLLYVSFRLMRRWFDYLRENKAVPVPRQNSVSLEISLGQSYRITATDNPFGCELVGFGGVVELTATQDSVNLRHGQRPAQLFALDKFSYEFADGYRLQLRQHAPRKYMLDLYALSETDSLATSAKL